jgi:GT2 family glycosyltransferase
MAGRFLFLCTVFNRQATTIACLRQLRMLCQEYEIDAQIVIVDDNSTDGTPLAIREEFPDVLLIEGVGELFWAGGMRLGYEIIDKENFQYDYLIPFNDDTKFLRSNFKSFFEEVISTEVLVGAFRSKSGDLTYGGRKQYGFWPLNFALPQKFFLGKEVDVANFNFVSIPKGVLEKLTFIDNCFLHNSADFDFSLRARKAGYPIRMSSQVLGIVERNSQAGTSKETSLGKWERLIKLFSAKEYPIKQRFVYSRRHGGITWPIWFLKPYIGNILKVLFT